jgi:dinuclear metal center YbgI/SA1388 family protein
MPTAAAIARFLDDALQTAQFADYENAHNGLQLDHRGPVRRIATAVDFSGATLEAAIARDANLLILHHGMFWGGTLPIVGPWYSRLSKLIAHDVAVYASHLPLDAHPSFGNCALLATALGLTFDSRFAAHRGSPIGVSGDCRISTAELLARTDAFARARGGHARASFLEPERVSSRWAIATGAGASSDVIREAAARGVDTLIVGEGPHHTTVDAPEYGLTIIYAGHYASETLGVEALAPLLASTFGVPAEFLLLPTGS